MNDQMPNVEQVIAGMRDETISAAAQVAWYWSYIGTLDMARQLGLIDDTRRQEFYHVAEKFKSVCGVKAVQQGDHLAAAEMLGEYGEAPGRDSSPQAQPWPGEVTAMRTSGIVPDLPGKGFAARVLSPAQRAVLDRMNQKKNTDR